MEKFSSEHITVMQHFAEKLDMARVTFLMLVYMRTVDSSPSLAEKLQPRFETTAISAFESFLKIVQEWNNGLLREAAIQQLFFYKEQLNLSMEDIDTIKESALWAVRKIFSTDISYAVLESFEGVFQEISGSMNEKLIVINDLAEK